VGLDVYVGPLGRYYAEGPTDVVERIARQQGVPFADGELKRLAQYQDHGIPEGDQAGPRGTAQASLAEDVVRVAVLSWREGLGRWLGDRLAEPLDWDESGQAPCFTDKPSWDGYGGTLLLAAHDEHPELAAPATVSADWPDDPAYQAATAPGAGSRYEQLLTPELWLPCPFGFVVRTQDVTGEEIQIGSSVALLDQLQLLRARHRLDGQVAGSGGDDHRLAPTAAAGLAVLLRLAERSVHHRVPMRLDF
jgi:hypothetical protein